VRRKHAQAVNNKGRAENFPFSDNAFKSRFVAAMTRNNRSELVFVPPNSLEFLILEHSGIFPLWWAQRPEISISSRKICAAVALLDLPRRGESARGTPLLVAGTAHSSANSLDIALRSFELPHKGLSDRLPVGDDGGRDQFLAGPAARH